MIWVVKMFTLIWVGWRGTNRLRKWHFWGVIFAKHKLARSCYSQTYLLGTAVMQPLATSLLLHLLLFCVPCIRLSWLACSFWHIYTHTCLTAPCPGLPTWASTRKVKPIRILLKQETLSGSSISWAICKSAHCFWQITMPAPHHSVFTGRMPLLQPNQQCQSTESILKPFVTYTISYIMSYRIVSSTLGSICFIAWNEGVLFVRIKF